MVTNLHHQSEYSQFGEVSEMTANVLVELWVFFRGGAGTTRTRSTTTLSSSDTSAEGGDTQLTRLQGGGHSADTSGEGGHSADTSGGGWNGHSADISKGDNDYPESQTVSQRLDYRTGLDYRNDSGLISPT